MARLNINIDEKLLSQLRIIAAVKDKTVTDIAISLISAYVRDNKKNVLETATKTLSEHNENEKHLKTNKNDHIAGNNLLLSLADQYQELVFTADDGLKYLRCSKIIKEQIPANIKPKQPKLNSKRQRAYLLPEATESPTSDD